MKAFAIKDPKGVIIPGTIWDNENDSIHAIPFADWKQLTKEGYTCVPVEITEIKEVLISDLQLAYEKAYYVSHCNEDGFFTIEYVQWLQDIIIGRKDLIKELNK